MTQLAAPRLQDLVAKMNEELEADRCTLYAVDAKDNTLHSILPLLQQMRASE